MLIRLQKIIAEAGMASRRKAEQLIQAGEVTVNGQIVTKLGVKADPAKDHITVQGRNISQFSSQKITYALYKPKNTVSTLSDPQGRTTIADFFPKTKQRLFPIGRLDYDAEGLILITNDGELAQKIAHPKKHFWKIYFVKLKGRLEPEFCQKLKKGPVIDGKKRQPLKIKIIHYINDKTWVEVALQEGVNRQIKKMFFDIGFSVLKIKRYQIGSVQLEELSPGESRRLTPDEIKNFN